MDTTVPLPRVQSKHLPFLDGWRGIAVLSVMVYHLWPRRFRHGLYFAEFGWMGVDLFFALSGFLITRILLAARDRPNYFRNFYARRALRIFPLYYAVVAVACLFWPLFGPHPEPAREVLPRAAAAFGHVTNLWQAWHHAWFPAPPPFLLGHLWSLAVEEQFYLVWPVVVLLVPDRRWMLAVCGGCVVLANVCRITLWANHASPMLPFVLTPCRVDGLALGAAIAVAVTQPAWAAVARKLAWVGFGLALAVIVAAGLRGHTFDHAGSNVMRTVGLSVSGPLWASALALTITAATAGGLVDRALSFAPLRWLGTYSYGLYVYHGLLGNFFRDHFNGPIRRHVGVNNVGDLCEFAATLGVILAISVVSFHGFERPIMRLKRYFPEPLATDDAQPRPAGRFARLRGGDRRLAAPTVVDG